MPTYHEARYQATNCTRGSANRVISAFAACVSRALSTGVVRIRCGRIRLQHALPCCPRVTSRTDDWPAKNRQAQPIGHLARGVYGRPSCYRPTFKRNGYGCNVPTNSFLITSNPVGGWYRVRRTRSAHHLDFGHGELVCQGPAARRGRRRRGLRREGRVSRPPPVSEPGALREGLAEPPPQCL